MKKKKISQVEEIPHRVLTTDEKINLIKIINMTLRKINYDLKLNFHM